MQNDSKQNILKQLDNGILPKELDFNSPDDTTEEEYWAKIQYNTFYKNPYYFINKFPNPTAFMNLPAAEEIINEMIEHAKTPLEEILERQVHITQKPEIKEYKRTDSIKLSNVLNINESSEQLSKSL
jgi:chemotaxis protein CheY-P-specific phosphatase CheC